MKIGVLTSSRADYSIYFPLLKALEADEFFELELICFGTHLSKKFGRTIDYIVKDGFNVPHQITTDVDGSSPAAVSKSIANTINAFSGFWTDEKFDWLLALGDRYEMFAACVSALPYNINLAHIHGGEKTLGAFDDVFRHSITHMSKLHFASAEPYATRIAELKGDDNNIFNVGALSIDNLSSLTFLSIPEFLYKFGIDLSVPSILITMHPETVSFELNEQYVDQLIASLNEIQGYQFIITMPNADTMGEMIRNKLNRFIDNCDSAFGVESFGTVGYLSCMKHCSFLLGNTSSGFIEASYFPKYVINLGDRQSGRIVTKNIRNSAFDKNDIIDAVSGFQYFTGIHESGIYGDGTAAMKILNILKKLK